MPEVLKNNVQQQIDIKNNKDKQDTQTRIKNKKEGKKDEWQLLNPGEFKKIVNDTRNIYTSRLDTLWKWCRINTNSNDVYTY